MLFPTDIPMKKHYAIKKMAETMGAKIFSMNNRASGIADVLGFDASPNTIDELLSTEYDPGCWIQYNGQSGDRAEDEAGCGSRR